jgi:hypothetical protein
MRLVPSNSIGEVGRIESFATASRPETRDWCEKMGADYVLDHRESLKPMPYAERIAWLASRKTGLEYSLDVHDPMLRLPSAALPSGLCHRRRRHHRDGTADTSRRRQTRRGDLRSGFPRNCAPVRPGFDACFLGATQHRGSRQTASFPAPPATFRSPQPSSAKRRELLDGTDRRVVGGAHAAFSDHSGSGMIGLAGFDRSLTRNAPHFFIF